MKFTLWPAFKCCRICRVVALKYQRQRQRQSFLRNAARGCDVGKDGFLSQLKNICLNDLGTKRHVSGKVSEAVHWPMPMQV